MIHTILVVEDDNDIQEYLKELLLDNGYSVKLASDGIEALKIIRKAAPDLVVLDLGLPKISGDAVCMEIRKEYPHLPIVILTAKDTTSDIIHGLSLGADDYIAKPFVGEELLARVKARLRHREENGAFLKIADLELDTKTMEVRRDGKLINLTPQEFKLLQYLMSNKGRVLTRDMILNRIWLYAPDIETRVVDVYIGYLRKKIDTGHKKKLITSMRGFGYTIKD